MNIQFGQYNSIKATKTSKVFKSTDRYVKEGTADRQDGQRVQELDPRWSIRAQ